MDIKVGDKVKHESRTEVGTVTKLIYRGGVVWYSVSWPSGVGTGAIYVASVLTVV